MMRTEQKDFEGNFFIMIFINQHSLTWEFRPSAPWANGVSDSKRPSASATVVGPYAAWPQEGTQITGG